MPGLTLWLSPLAPAAELSERFEGAQATMLHAPDYRATLELATAGCLLGHVAYPPYPVHYLRRPSFVIAVEGRVFGRSRAALEDELERLAPIALGDPAESAAELRRWILANDGDYVIAIADADGRRLVVLTDPLGRLPLYFHAGEIGVAVARECKFIASLRGTTEFDRLGWAQYLWIGYPLGHHTAFDGISRAPGGFYLRAEAVDGRVESTVEELFTCNLDEKDESVPRSRWPGDLAEAFVAAVESSVPAEATRPVVLSLSGGHDSRCVAAGLKRSGIAFSAATFRMEGRPEHASLAEAPIASRIAKQLGVPWELISLPEPSPEEVRRLVWMTDGLNYMTVILPFLAHLVSRFGREAIFVTGGGGDKTMPDRRPPRQVRDADELLEAVIAEHAVLPSDAAEDVMGLERGTLRADLERHLAGYPERDPVQKGVHFKISERSRKALFAAEDRNRLYLWHASPFWTFSFFRLAMSVPDDLKARYALYRDFKTQLDRSLGRIEHAGIGLSIRLPGLGRDLDLAVVGRRLPRPVKAAVKRALGRGGRGPAAWQRLTEERARQAARSPEAGVRGGAGEPRASSIMDPDAVRRMLETATHKQYWDWRTLALLEELWAEGPRR
jgi:asparagine synthase (glutamine-hydrolysing)